MVIKQTLKQKLDPKLESFEGKMATKQDPQDFFYSSASLYENGFDSFGFIKQVGDIF